MDATYWLRQARLAADDLRRDGREALPLAEAFYLDPPTERLLEALVGMGILRLEDVPVLGARRSLRRAA